MGRRLGMLGTAIALGALAVGVISPAWGSSGNEGRHTTFSVVAVTTEQNFVDLGAPGNSLGDQIVFTSNLLQDGKEIGHQAGVCTITSLARNEAQCIATYLLQGGQMTAQAVISLQNPAPYDVALTGGTGKYEGAEGHVHVQPISPTKGRLTFHLED